MSASGRRSRTSCRVIQPAHRSAPWHTRPRSDASVESGRRSDSIVPIGEWPVSTWWSIIARFSSVRVRSGPVSHVQPQVTQRARVTCSVSSVAHGCIHGSTRSPLTFARRDGKPLGPVGSDEQAREAVAKEQQQDDDREGDSHPDGDPDDCRSQQFAVEFRDVGVEHVGVGFSGRRFAYAPEEYRARSTILGWFKLGWFRSPIERSRRTGFFRHRHRR